MGQHLKHVLTWNREGMIKQEQCHENREVIGKKHSTHTKRGLRLNLLILLTSLAEKKGAFSLLRTMTLLAMRTVLKAPEVKF